MEFNKERYSATLKFILLKAAHEIFPKADIYIQHTLSNGLYGEVKNVNKIEQHHINKIKERMDEIIEKNYPISLVTRNIDDIRKKIDEINREDVKRIIKTTGTLYIREYELDGYHDYFYEKLYPTTGIIYLYDIISYEKGFILRFPIENFSKELPEYIETPKLSKTQQECIVWNEVMNVSDIGNLNEKTVENKIEEVTRVSETLHEVKLSEIANLIMKDNNIKLVTIAGPSSSGKTTFSKRLILYLKANKIFPIVISLDNYYIGRENVLLDEEGNKDYETIEALDLKLLNQNLEDLILGKEVEVPIYNFITGEREKKGKLMKIPKNGLLIIEGIHGLNEKLTEKIPRKNKFKIYISCLTQLNIDNHNRIPTNEVRKIRRIVRDSLTRGTNAEKTLSMWKSVRRGEEKYIFKYQEECDIMFDSNLVYELGVLKRFAIKELIKVEYHSEHYKEARRLIRFLECFVDIDDKYVPDSSLLREFIGGSYFSD